MFSRDADLGIMYDAYYRLKQTNPTLQPPSAPQKNSLTDVDRQKEEDELQIALKLSLQEEERKKKTADAAPAPSSSAAGGSSAAGPSGAAAAPKRPVVIKPNPINVEHEEKIAALEARIKRWVFPTRVAIPCEC